MPKIILRDHAAWLHSFLSRLPTGAVWPRGPTSVLVRTAKGLTALIARFQARAHVLANVESFPPTSLELLPDHERWLGLPEPCFPGGQTIVERQLQVAEKLARRPGTQSRLYFKVLAARLGYGTIDEAGNYIDDKWLPGAQAWALDITLDAALSNAITITEFRPFMVGVSQLGPMGWQIAPHQMRAVWVVNVPGARLNWFRCGAGGGQAGRDPLLRVSRALDLECVLKRFKPAHTNLIFNYSGV